MARGKQQTTSELREWWAYIQYRPSDYPEITLGKMGKQKMRLGLLPASPRTKKPGLEMLRGRMDLGNLEI
jgi:hypothetical protein